jgi:hypothetical protein
VPYSLIATNDQWEHLVLGFGAISNDTAPTTRLEAFGSFDVPENYSSTPVFRIRWNTSLTTGDVVWDVDYRAVGGDDTESLDQATQDEQITVTDSAGSAAHERLNVTISASANFAAGDTVTFLLARDGVAAGDTLAGMAMLHELFFEFSD